MGRQSEIGNRESGRRRGGFTLVEVLVAMLLVGVLLTIVMVPVVSSMGYVRSGSARADAQTVARNALDAMAGELSEAMAVQLDMEDNSAIAFTPPLRVDPNDSNSTVVTPPRPDWSRSVRFWRALNDPRAEYSSGTSVAAPNFYFLARTTVDDPFNVDDPWNPMNAANVSTEGPKRYPNSAAIADWAPIPRVVSWEKKDPYGGIRKDTYQPGYPYLDAQSRFRTDQDTLNRYYRDRVIGMTPSGNAFDVTSLTFTPMVVSGEWLQPGQAQDKSVYAARYPLWRLGANPVGWSTLSGESPLSLQPVITDLEWPRDPFLVIYRWDSTQGQYYARAVGCFDPRSRTMRILNWLDGKELYDTYDYPYRAEPAGPAFGVDWTRGSIRFDFPPYTTDTTMLDKPVVLDPTTFEVPQDRDLNRLGFDAPLGTQWQDWNGRENSPPVPLTQFILPDTVTVRIDTDGDGQPDRALKRVYREPRDYSDEFELGLNPDTGRDDWQQPRYGWIRLPLHFMGPENRADPSTAKVWVYYRWRTNGVVAPGETLAQEHPDLVSAYYRTASVIDIGISVARTDPSATGNSRRLAQSVHMTRRVKLPNAVREIRNEEG